MEEHSLDARLLSDAIIEINILRHKVCIYPEGHPIVEESLTRAFDFLKQLFELREEVTLRVAKDVIIIDKSFLDKKNPIYREFALSLSSKSIVCLTFTRGLTREELFTFYRFMAKEDEGRSPEEIREDFSAGNTPHVQLEFIDYTAFSFREGKGEKEGTPKHLWERYVEALFNGTLNTEEEHSVIREIPPEVFARLVNETAPESMEGETYERVVSTYVRKSSEKALLGRDLGKLIQFINRLRPGLKKQFLSSAFKNFGRKLATADEILREIPADEAIELLNTINQEKISIPDAIKNLLEKLSTLTPEGFKGCTFGDKLIVDDISLSENITTMLTKDDFSQFVNDIYSKEIKALLECDVSKIAMEKVRKFDEECRDERIEKDFNQTLLELISSDGNKLITEKDLEFFSGLLKDQMEHFIGTGQYDQVLKIIKTLRSRKAKEEKDQPETGLLPPDCVTLLIDSLRIVGSQNREDALLLCDYCHDQLAAPLVTALIREETRRIRKFLLELVVHLGGRAAPEALKHLADSRWFVTRNMLYILGECAYREALPQVRPYCNHENPKVRTQAIKYLLKVDRGCGIEVIRDCLLSRERERVESALAIAGAFTLTELVPDLIHLLRKMARRGSDFEHKIPIVRALGSMGDPRTLPPLKQILSSRSLLFNRPLHRLKEEIRKTLPGYPDREVEASRGDEEHPQATTFPAGRNKRAAQA